MERGLAWKATWLVFLIPLLFLPAGCYSEDDEIVFPADCCTTEYVTVSVRDIIDGADLTESGEITSADLFLFRSDGTYFDHVWIPGSTVRHRIPVSIKGIGIGGMQIVAWGNLNGNEVITGLDPGCKLHVPGVWFKTDANGSCTSPDDLFFGYSPAASLTTGGTGKMREIVVARKNARMNITVRGLPQGSDASEYYFVISGTKAGYNLRGEALDSSVNMKQAGVCSLGNNDLMTETPFVLAATAPGQRLTVNLCRYGADGSEVLVASVTKDRSGQLIAPSAGQTVNILIDLSTDSSPSVTIVVTPWVEVYKWVNW